VANIYFLKFTYRTSMQRAIVAIPMHAVLRGGPAIDAYERHTCRHPLLCWQLTNWVETSVLLLMRQLPQQRSTAARSVAVACRCARTHGSISCTLIGWPAVCESIKGEKDDRSFHLWVGAREDDMADWEPVE